MLGKRQTIVIDRYLVVVLGASQLPDLIDKPTVYYGLASSGRAAGHSLLGMLIICGGAIGVWWWLRRECGPKLIGPKAPLGMVVGYGTHLIGDSYRALLAGRWGEASYLLWPILDPPQYPSDDIPPWVRLARIYLEGGLHPQWWIILLAVVLLAGGYVIQRSQRQAKKS
jgi:hypothetical protein